MGHLSPDLRLERLPSAVVCGLLAGTLSRPAGWHPEFPTADTLGAARTLLAAYDALGIEPDGATPWWIFGIVVDGLVVGAAGFHGPPSEPPLEVEIGYQVVPALRGRGFATRACGLLLEHAWSLGVAVVHADVEPDNPSGAASRAVLRANGFRPAGHADFAVAAPAVRPA